VASTRSCDQHARLLVVGVLRLMEEILHHVLMTEVTTASCWLVGRRGQRVVVVLLLLVLLLVLVVLVLVVLVLVVLVLVC